MLLSGGLGNQLFQYAFARSLSLRSGAKLILDTGTFFKIDHRYKRQYALDAFTCDSSVRKFGGSGPFGRFYRRCWMQAEKGQPFSRRRFVDEPRPLGYYPEYGAWKLDRSACLSGYWQCPEYFRECEPQLREDLRFVEPLSGESSKLVEELEESTSVAVHLRRLDFGTKLTMRYYKSAIEQMRKRFGNARFFIFSDDPQWWIEEGQCGNEFVLMSAGNRSAMEDFQLMTHCRHFIIANSSFSWWAAWLGSATDKCVIAPPTNSWLNPNTIPEEWEVIQ
ncbi:alpha-1,2-fucosyltransferase [Oceanipulchritudo coccoides]|nr:alpha-1,2-fucosyltransferase [Oceanipulchritudo coccoides]